MMNSKSLEYLQVHTDIEEIINKLAPEILGTEYVERIVKLKAQRNNLLPAWLFVEAVEQTPVAISITDRKANILYVNQSFCKVTGYTAEEVLGKNESILSYKTTPNRVYYDLWKAISKNKTWEGRLLNKHKNGDPYLASLTIVPIKDTIKGNKHYLGLHRDVTKEYQTEKRLLNQKQLIESVINSSPEAVAVMDEHNKIVLDNLQYKKMVSDLGIKEPASLFIELITNEIGDVRDYMQQHLDGFNSIEIRLDNTKTNEPLWFSCSGQVIQEKDIHADSFFEDTSKPYLLLSINNITKQRKQHELSYLQSLKTVLAEEEQIRNIRETLLGTIHQVNQPLNQINAAIQLMRQRGEKGPLMDLLSELKDNCQDTVQTLQHCVPEVSPTSVTSINLNQMLYELINVLHQEFFMNGVTIEWRPQTTLPKILGAENRLRMLFKQLIDNAINALNSSNAKERNLILETYAQNKHVYVAITDSGPGIPDENLGKIFHPFFTTAKQGAVGSGMGLVMAREIVHQFEGTIEVDTDYTNGCRFVVGFPPINLSNT